MLGISDPAAPVRVGGYDTSGYAEDVAVSGGQAYVADGIGGLLILGISALTGLDFDADGDVDYNDFVHFHSCFGGASRPPAQSRCDGADDDGDGDVDLEDFAVFQSCFNGSGRPPACE